MSVDDEEVCDLRPWRLRARRAADAKVPASSMNPRA